MKKHNAFFILLMAGILVMSGCAGKNDIEKTIIELKESDFDRPQTVTVEKGDIQTYRTYQSSIGPKIEQLKFKYEGCFDNFTVDIGEEVKEGQILASADTKALRDSIQNKKKEIENLKSEYEFNVKEINLDKQMAQLELDTCRKRLDTETLSSSDYSDICYEAGEYDEQIKRLDLDLKQLKETFDLENNHANEQLRKLNLELEGSEIVSPYDGVVVALYDSQHGDYIDKNKYYVAVADVNTYYARCISEGISLIKNSIRMELWQSGKVYEAKYIPRPDSYYQEMRNSNEQQYDEFEINNENNELSFGDVGYIRYILNEHTDAIYIPINCLYTTNGEMYVYKDEGGNRIKTLVKTDLRNDLYVEITDGLKEGDVIYVQD